MKEDIRDIGEAAKDVRDAQGDQDNISLQTNEFSRDDDFVVRRSGRDAARLDEKVRLNSPLFMAKMLEELCVTYLELDNLLLKKPANKRNDLEPAWREGEGRDGTGEWGFEVQRSALERLTSMLGIGMQNDINDIFFIVSDTSLESLWLCSGRDRLRGTRAAGASTDPTILPASSHAQVSPKC